MFYLVVGKFKVKGESRQESLFETESDATNAMLSSISTGWSKLFATCVPFNFGHIQHALVSTGFPLKQSRVRNLVACTGFFFFQNPLRILWADHRFEVACRQPLVVPRATTRRK